MLKKDGSHWKVYDRKGKKLLGTHGTRTAALRQIAAIEAARDKEGK